ncbi:MAG: NUDIX domain-containing protein [Niabella sp.]
MQITVYIHNKPVYLCDRLDGTLEQLHHRPDTLFIDELDNHTVKAMLHEMTLPEISCGIFLHKDLETLKKQFFKKFEVHIAGGGLVVNKTGAILMIFRRGFWDLPKGHLDKGETIEACAIREVQEETGLNSVRITAPLSVTYHTYEHGTHHILKEAHWYIMTLEQEEVPVPQTEEDIELIEWVPPGKTDRYLKNAYPSIRDVVTGYLATR